MSLTAGCSDDPSIKAAVEAAGDVTVFINNAGASVSSAGILTHTDEEIRTNVETNFLGPAVPGPLEPGVEPLDS